MSAQKYMDQISALNEQAVTLRHNWGEEVAKLKKEISGLGELLCQTADDRDKHQHSEEQLLNRRDELLEEVAKLKKENEELKHREYCLRQDSKGHSPSEVQEYRDEIEELKKQAEIREGQFELSEAVLEQKIEKLEHDLMMSETNPELEELKKELEEKEGRWEVGQAITENVIKQLKTKLEDMWKEKEVLKDKATMYEYMAEFMEKSESFPDYFDWIKEEYPDKFIEAGGIVDSDEEDMEKEEQLLKAQIEGEQE